MTHDYALHLGVIHPHAVMKRTQSHFTLQVVHEDAGYVHRYDLFADGDSFLTWGETAPDATTHLIVGFDEVPGSGYQDFVCDVADALRLELGARGDDWFADEQAHDTNRISDYAVITSMRDFGTGPHGLPGLCCGTPQGYITIRSVL